MENDATALRQKLTAALQLRGLSERTQEACLRAVRQFADHYGMSPDSLDERVLCAVTACRNLSQTFPIHDTSPASQSPGFLNQGFEFGSLPPAAEPLDPSNPSPAPRLLRQAANSNP